MVEGRLQGSPVCPSEKSSSEMKSTERWWDDIDRGSVERWWNDTDRGSVERWWNVTDRGSVERWWNVTNRGVCSVDRMLLTGECGALMECY
jgi:hypothetical protein